MKDEVAEALLRGEYEKVGLRNAFRYLYSAEELLRFKAAEALAVLCPKSNARNYILRLFWLLSDESGAYCIGSPLGIAEIGRKNPDIFESFKIKFLYLLENEEVERSYVAYGILRNAEIYFDTEARFLLEKKALELNDQKFLAYSALAIQKLGGDASNVVKRISSAVKIYNGTDLVELDAEAFKDFIKSNIF